MAQGRLFLLFTAGFLLATTGATAQIEYWLSTVDGDRQLAAQPAPVWTAIETADAGAVTVDPGQRYQSILGFGASFEHATCYNLSKLSPEKFTETLTRLVHPVDGIGMNLMRVCIGTSDFVGEPWYSYNDLPNGETDPELEQFSIAKDRAYVLPVLKAALAINPDLKYFASPWSPPGWMKTTGTMLAGKLKPEYYGVYARYLVKFLAAYEAEGLPMHAMTPQNEPGYPNMEYPTCLWTPENQRDFIRDHLGPAMAEAYPGVELWCWDHNWNYLEFPRTVLSDPGAAQYVDGVAFHLYEGKVEAQSELHEQFPETPIYFTEGSTFGVRGAIKVIEILRNWARSYNAWVIMLDEERKPNNGPHSASRTCIELMDDGSVAYHFDYFMYGQFMKFIPRGATRIATPAGDRGFATVAVHTPDDRIVLVAANADREARETTIAYGNKAFAVTLPPQSVATFRFNAR